MYAYQFCALAKAGIAKHGHREWHICNSVTAVSVLQKRPPIEKKKNTYIFYGCNTMDNLTILLPNWPSSYRSVWIISVKYIIRRFCVFAQGDMAAAAWDVAASRRK
jgi:hypothetical protein